MLRDRQKQVGRLLRHRPASDAHSSGSLEQVAVIGPDFLKAGVDGRRQVDGIAGAQKAIGGQAAHQDSTR